MGRPNPRPLKMTRYPLCGRQSQVVGFLTPVADLTIRRKWPAHLCRVSCRLALRAEPETQRFVNRAKYHCQRNRFVFRIENLLGFAKSGSTQPTKTDPTLLTPPKCSAARSPSANSRSWAVSPRWRIWQSATAKGDQSAAPTSYAACSAAHSPGAKSDGAYRRDVDSDPCI